MLTGKLVVITETNTRAGYAECRGLVGRLTEEPKEDGTRPASGYYNVYIKLMPLSAELHPGDWAHSGLGTAHLGGVKFKVIEEGGTDT